MLAKFYEAGEVSRRTSGWKRPSGDPNAPSRLSLQRLRDAARHLIRNNGYAESGIDTITDDAVGWGITPTAKNAAWKKWAWSTSIDADGRCDIAGLQHLVMRTVVESGECLIRRRRRRLSDRLTIPLQIQVLEPDFIDTSQHRLLPNGGRIVRGVEFDPLGHRSAYWLFREHPGSTTISNTTRFSRSDRIPASEILHVFRSQRPGQVRGATWFAPVLIRFNDFDEFADATLMKQKIAACLTVITSDVDGSSPRIGAADPKDPTNETLDRIEPGLIANVKPGQNITVVQPPSVREYSDFVKTSLQEIASGIGVTPEDLTGDYSDMNFSAAKMSRLRHWNRVQGWRWRMLVPQFLDPLWNWAMEAAALAGLATDDNESWTAPPLPMIEPDKEGLAIIRNVRGGIQTFSEALRERGYDPDTFWDEYKADLEDLDRRGIVLDSDARQMTQAGQLQLSAGAPAPAGGENANGSGPSAETGDYLSIPTAAKRFEMNPETLRQWVRKGVVGHVRVGPDPGRIRVLVQDLARATAPS